MKTQKLLTSAAIAALITSAYGSVTIDWVTVGNSGNAADPLTGYGAVGYEYKIGKYEVTNAQYVEFLNAKGISNGSLGGYTTLSDDPWTHIIRSGSAGNYTYSVTAALANRPVVNVSWSDVARFANWMHNGQGNGDTETGAYDLNAYHPWLLPNSNAKFRLPTEDEWYKAAYYNAANQTYSLYPNGQNSIATADANYSSSASTNVGTYASDSSLYGTFDQGGNVWEWNDAYFTVVDSKVRGVRGGSFYYGSDFLRSTYRSYNSAHAQNNTIGFRLASAIPEPSAILLTIFAGGAALIRRKR